MSERSEVTGWRLPRRALLVGAGAAGIAVTVPSLTGEALAADDFTPLRDRWRDILTGASQIDPNQQVFRDAIARLDNTTTDRLALIDRSSGRNRVFTDQPLAQTTNSAPITDTYQRLYGMAVTYRTPGSQYEGSADLLADILAGLDTANRVVYHDGRTPFDNWWDWEIGASNALANCMVLLDEHLPSAARSRYGAALSHFIADPWFHRNGSRSVGANRVDVCQAAAVHGIAVRSSSRLQRAANGLPAVCEHVSSGNGFYADGSFIQHTNIAYTGTYGVVLLTGMANLLALLAGSTWQVTNPIIQNLYTAVELAYAPVIHDGRMMDFVRGRAIARSSSSDHSWGHTAIEAALRLAHAVDVPTAARWRARCRGWLDRDTSRDPFAGGSVRRIALLTELYADTGIQPAPEPDGCWVFRNMDRAVHRRAGWAFAVSMYSSRIAPYEAINGENLKGFHTGAGMTYLYDSDSVQYSDAFWPTVDPYRLPGITVEKKTLADATGKDPSSANWAGGVVLDGRYGAVGQNLQGPASPLSVKKSWFCFDEYIVALGTDIRCASSNRVETIVDNRNLHTTGSNALVVDSVAQPVQQGWSATFSAARWAHLEGVAGYVFPGGAALKAIRHERTGTWLAINRGGSATPITRRYATLWFDHGTNPAGLRYAYLVVPRATVERTAQLAASPGVSILANTSTVQAVQQPATGITMVNFWGAGSTSGITANADCSVIRRQQGDTLTVAASRPTHNSATVRIQLAAEGYRLRTAHSAVTVVSSVPRLVLDVDPGDYGAPRQITLTRKLAVTAVTASGHDGNVPENTLDNDLASRWSARGDGAWIQYDLGAARTVGAVAIAWYGGDTRATQFEVQTSTDSTTWRTVLNRSSSSNTVQPETYDIADHTARYVRVVGHGNTSNDWNSITDLAVLGPAQ